MSDLNVYQRLAVCKKKVAESSFSKVKGEGLKYAYLPIETIKPVVEDAMNDAGLVLEFGKLRTKDIREPWDSQSPYGPGSTRWYHIAGEIDMTWVNIDDPKDRITMTFLGEAKDNSDKVFSKCYVSCIKNGYKAIFNISTDRKEDTDNTEDEMKHEKGAPQPVKKDAFFSPGGKDPFFGKGAQ